MSDLYPRQPADEEEREACERKPHGKTLCNAPGEIDWESGITTPTTCSRRPHSTGDHVSAAWSDLARPAKVLARWPQAPGAEPAAVTPLNASRVVAEARRICARAEEGGETSAEIVTLSGELRSMDASQARDFDGAREEAGRLRARLAEVEGERDAAREQAASNQRRREEVWQALQQAERERDAATARAEAAEERAERADAALRDLADYDCSYGDGCPTFGSGHGQCVGCKAREALAVPRG